MYSATEALAEGGLLARQITGFAPRQQQQEMAEQVALTLDQHSMLVCEAGTGTGKTFAYLVPALMSGKKVIISTGTKNLQDQLFHRDLPVVRKALGISVVPALLKGRANYLCLHRLESVGIGAGGVSHKLQQHLSRVLAWKGRTVSGDISEISDVPENSPVWPYVTSTTENCLGQDCPQWSDCHVVKARREAMDADIVVVNHHLFLADMSLRETGFGEVLPGADAVVFDEAHQLYELASRFFGETISSRQLLDLCRDSQAALLTEAGDMPELEEASDKLEKAVRDFRLTMGQDNERGTWHQLTEKSNVLQALHELGRCLGVVAEGLGQIAERGRDLESVARRAGALTGLLQSYVEGRAELPVAVEQTDTEEHSAADPEQPEAETVSTELVQWYELNNRGFLLHATPIDVAAAFKVRRAHYHCSWTFTSATLAVSDNFSHFQQRLGLEEAASHCWGSPFDYENQAIMYLPRIAFEPRDREYIPAVVEAAVPVLKASQGHAFFLFTSHRALRQAAELLVEKISYPIMVQGDAPKGELLERYRRTPNCVLLGTSSFWEGVDVRGESLTCVIIDKLPFAAPDDPVMQARMKRMEERGQNPFMHYQVPEAVISLKQGVGRLIRDVNDYGVLMLCDPRLTSKSYGKIFLASCPPMRRTREIADVADFFDTIRLRAEKD
jgi:ATP-dependent DNA helicase DinG